MSEDVWVIVPRSGRGGAARGEGDDVAFPSPKSQWYSMGVARTRRGKPRSSASNSFTPASAQNAVGLPVTVQSTGSAYGSDGGMGKDAKSDSLGTGGATYSPPPSSGGGPSGISGV